MAYDRIDPIGAYREDFGWGAVCSTVTNLALDIYAKKGHRPKYTCPSDFIPDWGQQGKRVTKGQTVEEQKAILLSIARMHNKRRNHG